MYTPGDEYLYPQVGIRRKGMLWQWDICIENRISIYGRALTRRGASHRAHRLKNRVKVIPKR